MTGPPPYFPFYPKDFASDGNVEAMTTEQVGAYILLLGKAWHETPPCSVPDDDRILARWTRLGDDGWARARSAVLAPFTLRDGRLYQLRLEREWRKCREYQVKQSQNGRKGGQASVNRRSSGASPSLEQPPSPSISKPCVSTREPASQNSPGELIVRAALDSWSQANRGQGVDAVHGEWIPIRNALLCWEKCRAMEGGEPIAWYIAVQRCVLAAQAEGTAFKGAKYAIKVIGGKLDEWCKSGILPERPASQSGSQRSGANRVGASQRRADRATREFEEQFDETTLPIVGGNAAVRRQGEVHAQPTVRP